MDSLWKEIAVSNLFQSSFWPICGISVWPLLTPSKSYLFLEKELFGLGWVRTCGPLVETFHKQRIPGLNTRLYQVPKFRNAKSICQSNFKSHNCWYRYQKLWLPHFHSRQSSASMRCFRLLKVFGFVWALSFLSWKPLNKDGVCLTVFEQEFSGLPSITAQAAEPALVLHQCL